MKLTQEQLKTILIGALDISEENGKFVLSRFTEKQIAYYHEKSPHDLSRKVYTSAGMRLDLITDAEAITFDYWVKDTSQRTFYSFDLYVDGIFCDELYVMNLHRKKEGTVSFSIPEGKHRVTVYFPNMMRTDIAHVELQGATFAEPSETKTKLLLFGDSITQGYDAYHSSLSYANRIARALDADILNQAIGGEVFDADILDENIVFDPDTVIVAYGTNDWAKCPTKEAFLEEAERFFINIKALYGEKKLVYISPIFRVDVDDNVSAFSTFANAVEDLKALAVKQGFFLVDGFRLTPHISDFFADLYLHPNDLGFGFYAENLLKELERI
ncbi:MAG: SGNH/GDSL hydrolase family protein [Clostridia bacterium]|nr:SGNH/GDSL hydrolase family protein [Clostridia bacterium]